MPPRTTQQSCRPRVSDRTMVGPDHPRAALEAQPRQGVTTPMRKNPGPNPVPAPLQAHHCRILARAGCRTTSPQEGAPVFLLDIPFYRTRRISQGNNSAGFHCQGFPNMLGQCTRGACSRGNRAGRKKECREEKHRYGNQGCVTEAWEPAVCLPQILRPSGSAGSLSGRHSVSGPVPCQER